MPTSLELLRQNQAPATSYQPGQLRSAVDMLQRMGQYQAPTPQAPAPQPVARTSAPAQAPAPQVPAPSQGGGSLFSDYQQKLEPIKAQSQQLLKEYYALEAQVPGFAQRLLSGIKEAGLYPNQAEMRAKYMENPNLTPSAIEGLVSRRGMSQRGSIQDLINTAVGGVQGDVSLARGRADVADRQRSNLLEEYGLESGERERIEDKRRWEAEFAFSKSKSSGGGTQTERAKNKAMQQAQLDASKGATSEQLARAYGSDLEPWELLQVYSGANFYNEPIEDLESQFYKWLPGYEGGEEDSGGIDREAVVAFANQVENNEEYTLNDVPKEYQPAVASLLNSDEGYN